MDSFQGWPAPRTAWQKWNDAWEDTPNKVAKMQSLREEIAIHSPGSLFSESIF